MTQQRRAKPKSDLTLIAVDERVTVYSAFNEDRTFETAFMRVEKPGEADGHCVTVVGLKVAAVKGSERGECVFYLKSPTDLPTLARSLTLLAKLATEKGFIGE